MARAKQEIGEVGQPRRSTRLQTNPTAAANADAKADAHAGKGAGGASVSGAKRAAAAGKHKHKHEDEKEEEQVVPAAKKTKTAPASKTKAAVDNKTKAAPASKTQAASASKAKVSGDEHEHKKEDEREQMKSGEDAPAKPTTTASTGGASSSGKLKLGDALPPFTLPNQDDVPVSLSDVLKLAVANKTDNDDNDDLRGVVLFSYPAASTPGCTAQACSYRDNSTSLPTTTGTTGAGTGGANDDDGVVKARFLKDEPGFLVLGISTDTPAAQGKFATRQALPYTLLSDRGGDGLLKRLGGVTAAKKTSQRCHWVVVVRTKTESGQGGDEEGLVVESELINVSIGTKPKDCVDGVVSAIRDYRQKSQKA